MTTIHQRPHWTFGLVIRKKPMKFAALALFLTAALVACLDPVLTALVRGAGIQGDATPIAAAGLAVFFAVAVAASGVLLAALSNLRLSHMTPEAAQALFDKQCRFFWSRMYSLVLGYFLWGISFTAGFAIVRAHNGSFLAELAVFTAAVLLALFMFNGFNALMIHLTGTNKELIAEFKAGRYLSQLPASCRDQASIQGILHVLETGEAGSIRGAVIWFQIKRTVYAIYRKVARVLGKAALVILVIAVILGITVGDYIGKQLDDAAKSFGRDLDRRQRERDKAGLEYELKQACYKGSYDGARSRR